MTAYNAQHGANLGIKLRVWGGFTAPDWAKNIDGPALTITGKATVDPTVYNPQTIGRFWTADYVDAWNGLQNAARQPLRQQSPDPRHFPDGRRRRPPTNPSCR